MARLIYFVECFMLLLTFRISELGGFLQKGIQKRGKQFCDYEKKKENLA